MEDDMKEIRNIEDKYGLIPFRMGLTHLFDVGHRHFFDGNAETDIAQIIAEGEADNANGVHSMITPEFKCEIVRCASELSHYSIWTLFAYIKKHVVTD